MPVNTAEPGDSKPVFRATNVAVTSARTQASAAAPVSQSRPDGTSTASTRPVGVAARQALIASIAAALDVAFVCHTATLAPGPNLEARARAARRELLPEEAMKGHNAHHQAETVFKAFGRALRMAMTLDPRSAGVIPSTKGSL